MSEADVVVTLGRRLDFQLAYGSPAVFGAARFVRIADVAAELRDNRRGDVEVLADCGRALEATVAACVGKEAVVVADGGDFLSFARVGMPAATWLDPGSLGCIVVGTPFGI